MSTRAQFFQMTNQGMWRSDNACHGISFGYQEYQDIFLRDDKHHDMWRLDDAYHGIHLPDNECQGICLSDAVSIKVYFFRTTNAITSGIHMMPATAYVFRTASARV